MIVCVCYMYVLGMQCYQEGETIQTELFPILIISAWIEAPIRIFLIRHFTALYTERQKKHHFFRSTLTKIHSIKINHI